MIPLTARLRKYTMLHYAISVPLTIADERTGTGRP